MERTGRLITSASVLLAVAIGAFATSKLVFLKEVGLGVAAAVLIDAFVVRALLVPSLMALLGRGNWWAPAALVRLHQRLGLTEAEPSPRARPRPAARLSPPPAK
jgi:RND superfamily putative drug exporter